jgi:hypothetical protein
MVTRIGMLMEARSKQMSWSAEDIMCEGRLSGKGGSQTGPTIDALKRVVIVSPIFIFLPDFSECSEQS